MFKSLKLCKKTSHQLILIEIRQKVYGYDLKRLTKFEQTLWVRSGFTMSQSLSMKTSFVCKNTYGILTTFLDSDYAEC